jgi:DNA-binding SARP family transcriptional activator
MRAHVAAGNAAEALRAYERTRRLMADELGVDPSAESRALFAGILAER